MSILSTIFIMIASATLPAGDVEQACEKASGLTAVRTIRCSDANCMYDEIDGAAEKIIKAGGAAALFIDLGIIGETNPLARVEIFTSQSQSGGRKILDAVEGNQKNSDRKGARDTSDPARTIFASGPHMIKIYSLHESFKKDRITAIKNALENLLEPGSKKKE